MICGICRCKAAPGAQSISSIFTEEHRVDKPYIEKNYKDILKTLSEDEQIKAVNSKNGCAKFSTGSNNGDLGGGWDNAQ
ncbi:MAG: hypothetical protein LBR71_03245 [Synergistaceae bacterium]|jgi:hypothetical protein|nr:hypothetical protein [Synergistaceae bacterium]